LFGIGWKCYFKAFDVLPIEIKNLFVRASRWKLIQKWKPHTPDSLGLRPDREFRFLIEIGFCFLRVASGPKFFGKIAGFKAGDFDSMACDFFL